MEEILIKKIKGRISAVKCKAKTPKEAGVGVFLNKLKNINKPMYDELMSDYKAAVSLH
jgi:hypothetical protein